MRLIKGFLLGILGMCIMVTLLSLLIPSTVVVSRGVMINAPTDSVFKLVADLERWKEWHPALHDSAVITQFHNKDANAPDFIEWKRNGMLNRLLLDNISADSIVTVTLRRKGENDNINQLSVLPLTDRGGTQVTWRSVSKLKWYPWEKFSGIFIEKMSGPGYEAALNNLKAYAEK